MVVVVNLDEHYIDSKSYVMVIGSPANWGRNPPSSQTDAQPDNIKGQVVLPRKEVEVEVEAAAEPIRAAGRLSTEMCTQA